MAGGGRVKIKGGVASHNEATVTDGALNVVIEGGGGSTTNHNLLLNLTAPNDAHTQYYHIDGRRALTGDMDAGNNDIENIKNLGVGIAAAGYLCHIVSGASGGAANAVADELVIECAGDGGLTISCPATDQGNIFFGDSAGSAQGRIGYNHNNDHLRLYSANAEQLRLSATGVRIEDGVTAAAGTDLVLDVTSTTAAFAPPRMTLAQRNAIGAPATGYVVYNADEEGLQSYDDTEDAWLHVGPADYAEIYTTGGAGSSNCTTGGTFQKLDQFATNGIDREAVSDQANNKITLTNAGYYNVDFGASFDGTNGTEIQFKVYLNGVAQNNIHIHRTLGTPSIIGSGSRSGRIYAATAGLDLEVYWTATADNDDVDIKTMNLSATRIA